MQTTLNYEVARQHVADRVEQADRYRQLSGIRRRRRLWIAITRLYHTVSAFPTRQTPASLTRCQPAR